MMTTGRESQRRDGFLTATGSVTATNYASTLATRIQRKQRWLGRLRRQGINPRIEDSDPRLDIL